MTGLAWRSWWRYVGVGGMATALHYSVLALWVEVAGGDARWGAALGATAGGLLAYHLHRRVSFESQTQHRHALPRFTVVALLTAGLSAGAVAAAQAVHLHYAIGQVLATGAGLVLGYLLNRAWSFR